MPYDVNALQQELNVFTQWFTGSLLDYDLNDDDHAVINELSRLLIDSAVAQPQCLVHRDYHARNIMLFENQIAMIDFQDALWGPISYDVVSLLKDCYIKWPRDLTITCLNDYYTLVCSQREMPDFKMFVEQFDLMGLQRHIKVLGVFSRLSKRDNKHAYLNDLPRVIEYVRETAAMYPQTQNFVIWFDKHLLPLAEKQHWYKQVSI